MEWSDVLISLIGYGWNDWVGKGGRRDGKTDRLFRLIDLVRRGLKPRAPRRFEQQRFSFWIESRLRKADWEVGTD